jgi:hypothetical protein
MSSVNMHLVAAPEEAAGSEISEPLAESLGCPSGCCVFACLATTAAYASPPSLGSGLFLRHHSTSHFRPLPSLTLFHSLKMGLIRCPKTSVKDYHSMVRNTPEELRSQSYGCIMICSITLQIKICTTRFNAQPNFMLQAANCHIMSPFPQFVHHRHSLSSASLLLFSLLPLIKTPI